MSPTRAILSRRRTYQNRLFRGVLGSDIHLPVDRWGHTRPEQSLVSASQNAGHLTIARLRTARAAPKKLSQEF